MSTTNPTRQVLIEMLQQHAASKNDGPTDADRQRRRERWLVKRNATAAMAVGACPCWGSAQRCPSCGGEGRPGWTDPDPEAFTALVEPALDRLGLLREDEDERWDTSPERQQ